MIPDSAIDFRHCMCCHDCSAFYLDKSFRVCCRLNLQETNRPETVPQKTTRLDLSVYDGHVLRQWPCELRYTVEEIRKMQEGDLRGASVTKRVSLLVMQMTDSFHDERNIGEKWRM